MFPFIFIFKFSPLILMFFTSIFIYTDDQVKFCGALDDHQSPKEFFKVVTLSATFFFLLLHFFHLHRFLVKFCGALINSQGPKEFSKSSHFLHLFYLFIFHLQLLQFFFFYFVHCLFFV